MKRKHLRILSIVAVLVSAFVATTTAFAATVNTATKYIVGAGASTVNMVEVETTVSNGTPGSEVAYIVTSGVDATPSSSNILYLNQYTLDNSGAATITYKIDTSAVADFSAQNYLSTVRYGSDAGDTFLDSSSQADNLKLETYRVIPNGDGATVSVLPTEGYEIQSVAKNGSPVSTLPLTYTASENDTFSVVASPISGFTVGDSQIAAAKMTISNADSTVSCLLQPVAGNNIKEMGIKYGKYLFPSLSNVNGAPFIGITTVKLDFSRVNFSNPIDVGGDYTFSSESAKCQPYYILNNELSTVYYYDGRYPFDSEAVE